MFFFLDVGSPKSNLTIQGSREISSVQLLIYLCRGHNFWSEGQRWCSWSSHARCCRSLKDPVFLNLYRMLLRQISYLGPQISLFTWRTPLTLTSKFWRYHRYRCSSWACYSVVRSPFRHLPKGWHTLLQAIVSSLDGELAFVIILTRNPSLSTSAC